METVLMKALIRSWASVLATEIDRVEDLLPTKEEKIMVRNNGGLLVGMFISTPESNPEDFHEETRTIPIDNLDALRGLLEDMNTMLEEIG